MKASTKKQPMSSDLKKKLALIFGFVFVDLLGYSLILPLLPYYADTFGASITLVGLLGTSNALAQLVAAPIIGRLSDRYGRRPLLIFSIAGTVFSFLLLGFARSLTMLFISRIMDGLLGGNIALARAYITDVTDEKTRSRGLGIIGAAFGVGFIIGPAMGGFLSQFGFNVPAFVAAGLSTINLILVIALLPESLSADDRKKMRSSPHTRFTFTKLREELKRPCVGNLLYIGLFYSLAFTLFQSNFALFTKQRLGLSAQSTSFILTYVGLLSVFVQGFAIGFLTDRFKERTLILSGAVIMTASLFAWGFSPNVPFLLVVLAPISLSAGILNVVLTSQLTKSVYKEDVGGTLGLSAALQTVAQIAMPGIGGVLLDYIGPASLGLTGGTIMAGTALFIYSSLMRQPEQHGPCCRCEEEDLNATPEPA